MASNKIDDMVVLATAAGTELMFASDSGTPKSMTTAVLKQYVIDAIEAISAASSVTGSDSVFVLQGGVLKPADIDLIAQHAIDTVWGKSAIVTPVDADVMVIEDGGVEKTVVLSVLAEYVRSTIEAAILDVSDLSDGSGTIATTDYVLVTQTTTAKRIQISDLSTLIYASLAGHVTGLGGSVTAVAADELYFVRSGVGDKMTLAELAVYVAAQATVNGSGTADYLAKWTDADTLAAGYSVLLSGGDLGAGSDAEIATTKAVREELDDLITDGVTKELHVPASAMTRCTTGFPAVLLQYEYPTNDIDFNVLAFDSSSVERVQFQTVMPPGWDRGTIKAKFHWNGLSGSLAGDTIEWGMKAGAFGNDDALDTALGTGVVISDTMLTASITNMHITDATPAMTVAGSPSLGDIVVFEFYRNVGETDDMAFDAWLFGVTLQYTEDKVVAAW